MLHQAMQGQQSCVQGGKFIAQAMLNIVAGGKCLQGVGKTSGGNTDVISQRMGRVDEWVRDGVDQSTRAGALPHGHAVNIRVRVPAARPARP